MNKEANSSPSRREFLESLMSVGVLAIANNKGDVLSNVVQDSEEQQPLSALDQETLESLFEATGVQSRLENKHIQEIISNWSIVHNEATSNIELVDTAYPYLGSIAVGRSVVNENGQNVIEWEPRYQVQDNVRLVEMSLKEDGAIGKEPVPFYVRKEDSIFIENLGITWNFWTVMSADQNDLRYTSESYELLDKYKENIINFTKNHMSNSRGMTYNIRLLDEDPTVLSYLQTTSLDNYTFLQHKILSDGVPDVASGAEPAQNDILFYNVFLNRSLSPDQELREDVIAAVIAGSIISIESDTYLLRGKDPYSVIQNGTQKFIELGVDGPRPSVPLVRIHLPN
jgi:hypothetical protein